MRGRHRERSEAIPDFHPDVLDDFDSILFHHLVDSE